jgi:acetaldehyde dehydrogenase
MARTKVAIIGSGNIGTDLMFKITRLSNDLELALMVGIDPRSDGLARARRIGIATTDRGVDGLINAPDFADIKIVFDATSAGAHIANARALESYGKQLIDLTPAALGPFVVPVVNLDENLDARDLNMVTCGGQATIPIVAAVSGVTPVHYAEIVATIASKSAGVGTRQNIDEFTETTADALCRVGGAKRGKAIIILNPAEPPMIMRDTVHVVVDASASRTEITSAIERQVARVAEYVPGYSLKQDVQFAPVAGAAAFRTITGEKAGGELLQVSAYLQVEGAAQYLPSYAGNLDIMTSAALRVAERVARRPSPVPS